MLSKQKIVDIYLNKKYGSFDNESINQLRAILSERKPNIPKVAQILKRKNWDEDLFRYVLGHIGDFSAQEFKQYYNSLSLHHYKDVVHPRMEILWERIASIMRGKMESGPVVGQFSVDFGWPGESFPLLKGLWGIEKFGESRLTRILNATVPNRGLTLFIFYFEDGKDVKKSFFTQKTDPYEKLLETEENCLDYSKELLDYLK